MSSKLTGQKTFHLSFDEVDFENKFDGIWACASLLHIPRKDINVALNKLTRALKCQGILYASFKYGSLELNKSKRFFNNYDEDSFLQLLSEHLSLELIRFYITEDVRPEKSNEKWLNVLLQKNNS